MALVHFAKAQIWECKARQGRFDAGVLTHQFARQVPWNDWEITDDTTIQICRRKDGSEWLLGAGSSGRVGLSPGCFLHRSACVTHDFLCESARVQQGTCLSAACCHDICPVQDRRLSSSKTLLGLDLAPVACSPASEHHVLQVYKATLGLQTVAVKVFTSQATSEEFASAAQGNDEFGREISILKVTPQLPLPAS